MVKYKILSTILIVAAASAQAVLAADVSGFERRQSSMDDMGDMGDNENRFHQVYEWFDRTGLAGFAPARLSPNATAVEKPGAVGPYKPGAFQAALQSCLDDFVDETQFCITRFGHATEPNPDDKIFRASQGSSAILCCKGGYAAYLFNYRRWGDENHDVRINCYNAALIANETLSSLLNKDTMNPVFQGPEKPIVQIGDNSSSTHMARSYWSEDKSWGIDIYYLEGGTGSNSISGTTNEIYDACPSESPYTWVERGKWADLDKPVEKNPAEGPAKGPVNPTLSTDAMTPEKTATTEGTMATIVKTATKTMTSITGDATIQTLDPTAPGSLQLNSTTSEPTPTDDPNGGLSDGDF
ncbi:uncharacterized protein DFL_005329 [Arthrobotrys flagrans]|uniref:Ecp2 effector protein domain-containing protein n=1 Tax=Arthrobotrys flagrans TaxID=97331 RepID=A0A437A7H9_ARTFL|nr:hypothetical protein DFL_005329 [Arthrobotrys flagrans]